MDNTHRSVASGLRTSLLFVAFLGAIGLFLFVPAGRLDWAAGWVWLGVMAVGLLGVRAHVLRINPSLPARRRRVGSGTPRWDRLVLNAFRWSVLASLVLAALDAGRFQWSSLPAAGAGAGIGLLAVGFVLFGAAIGHNPFFESTVRIQSELGHRVASAGPYRLVRHPGYAGLMLIVLGGVLLLGSAWALLPTAFALAVLTLRTALEDRFLRLNLPGYDDYAASVRSRLVPGVW